jgi:hypothetical protein
VVWLVAVAVIAWRAGTAGTGLVNAGTSPRRRGPGSARRESPLDVAVCSIATVVRQGSADGRGSAESRMVSRASNRMKPFCSQQASALPWRSAHPGEGRPAPSVLVLSEHVGAAGREAPHSRGSTSLSATLLKLHRTAAFSAVLAANRNAASDLLHRAVGEIRDSSTPILETCVRVRTCIPPAALPGRSAVLDDAVDVAQPFQTSSVGRVDRRAQRCCR